MTLEECYTKMNGDYEDVLLRLSKPERITKYLGRIAEDPIFEELFTSFADADYQTAFRAVHTIKGEAANLGLTPLATVASTLTEALRGGEPPMPESVELLEKVKAQYQIVMDVIAAYQAGNTA